MEALGLSDSDIRKSMRGDLRRMAVAKVLDNRTTVSQKSIAQRLNMKSAANVSQQVRRFSELPERHLQTVIRTLCLELLTDTFTQRSQKLAKRMGG